MASSQVEMASSSPFGCVLRDHNRRDRCRESTVRAAQAAFHKNLKELVRDHLHNCIPVSSDSASDNNSQNQNSRFMACNSDSTNNNNNNNNSDKFDDGSTSSPRQSRVIDRWAARQAQETVSTMERQSHEAERLALANSHNASPRTAPSSRRENPQNSPVHLDNSSEIQNLGASSLVQIWEARVNRSNSMNANNPMPSASRTSSGLSYTENASCYVEEPSRGSEMDDSVDERLDTQTNNEDSLADWESQSDRTVQSDAGESERLRVADIIRRLTNDDHEHANNANESPHREQIEQRGISQVVSSPRIRGRQAFADLLMQIERDRHRELNKLVERQAVSRFTHRGRLQSLLRLRFLQRGMAIQDQQRRQHPKRTQCPQSTTECEVNRLSQGSTIMHLREKFSTCVEDRTSQSDASDSRSPVPEMVNNTTHTNNSSIPNQMSEDSHHYQEVVTTGQKSTPPVEHSVSHKSEDFHEEASARSDVTWQGANLESDHHEEASARSDVTWQGTNLEPDHHEEASSSSYVTWQGTSLEATNLDFPEIAESTTSFNGWDENEVAEEDADDQQHLMEPNYDWFSDIARPRSYWEDRRKAWYQEMLSGSSDNEEIRQLLERGRVSTFLSSDFRERMDRLMVSHMQLQIDPAVGQQDEEQDEGFSQERLNQLMLSYLQRHAHSVSCPEEEEEEQEVDEEEEEGEEVEEEEEDGDDDDDDDDDDDEDEEEEEEEEEEGMEEVDEAEVNEEGEAVGAGESPISHQYHEASDYFDQSSSSFQMPSPSQFGSWGYRDHEVGEDSDQVPSRSSLPHRPSQSYYRDTQRHSSSTDHPSIEMELIYDLRGNVEQLRHEMYELRTFIKSCMDMQVKLQDSIKQEVISVLGEGKNSPDRVQRKLSCCICYEMQVDSLLYRCGHMCTCLKCAHELQWSTGKCPICRAPIEDVVRAYTDS